MKKVLFAYILTFVACTTYGQQKDTWVAFDLKGKDITLTGFKDSKGVLRIEPIFTGFTVARKFDAIMGVMEMENNRYSDPYYFTKSGKIIMDSVYVADYQFDCESEGYIRFKDPKTGNIGIFNGDAKVVIPATYNDLTPVHNGLMIGLKGAKKENDGKSFIWTGGAKQIVDINNKVLIEDFKYDGHLNFYSLRIADTEDKESGRHNFKGADGKYYSFTDFNESFKQWINEQLFKEVTEETLLAMASDEIRYFDSSKKWVSEDKNTFISRNSKLIVSKLMKLKSNNSLYDTATGFITTDMFPPEKYSEYYDNCNKIKYEQYPVMSITIKESKPHMLPDNLYFVYTNSGYKLIGISAKNITLK